MLLRSFLFLSEIFANIKLYITIELQSATKRTNNFYKYLPKRSFECTTLLFSIQEALKRFLFVLIIPYSTEEGQAYIVCIIRLGTSLFRFQPGSGLFDCVGEVVEKTGR